MNGNKSQSSQIILYVFNGIRKYIYTCHILYVRGNTLPPSFMIMMFTKKEIHFVRVINVIASFSAEKIMSHLKRKVFMR